MTSPDWLDLDGTVNTRDVGGLPVRGGRSLRSGRLLRSDNLQDLTAADVQLLLDRGLQTVIDLRSNVEVDNTGPHALHGRTEVTVRHLSLFPEADRRDKPPVVSDTDDGPEVLPWQDQTGERAKASARTTYLRYLQDRPDSALTALRLIAHSEGASLVHCAAGKDRTGVVIALALSAVGVERDAIVADYVVTGERLEAILDRLIAEPLYSVDPALKDASRHLPKAATMQGLLDDLDETFGGAEPFLRANGWTDEDASALRSSLLG